MHSLILSCIIISTYIRLNQEIFLQKIESNSSLEFTNLIAKLGNQVDHPGSYSVASDHRVIFNIFKAQLARRNI